MKEGEEGGIVLKVKNQPGGWEVSVDSRLFLRIKRRTASIFWKLLILCYSSQ